MIKRLLLLSSLVVGATISPATVLAVEGSEPVTGYQEILNDTSQPEPMEFPTVDELSKPLPLPEAELAPEPVVVPEQPPQEDTTAAPAPVVTESEPSELTADIDPSWNDESQDPSYVAPEVFQLPEEDPVTEDTTSATEFPLPAPQPVVSAETLEQAEPEASTAQVQEFQEVQDSQSDVLVPPVPNTVVGVSDLEDTNIASESESLVRVQDLASDTPIVPIANTVVNVSDLANNTSVTPPEPLVRVQDLDVESTDVASTPVTPLETPQAVPPTHSWVASNPAAISDASPPQHAEVTANSVNVEELLAARPPPASEAVPSEEESEATSSVVLASAVEFTEEGTTGSTTLEVAANNGQGTDMAFKTMLPISMNGEDPGSPVVSGHITFPWSDEASSTIEMSNEDRETMGINLGLDYEVTEGITLSTKVSDITEEPAVMVGVEAEVSEGLTLSARIEDLTDEASVHLGAEAQVTPNLKVGAELVSGTNGVTFNGNAELAFGNFSLALNNFQMPDEAEECNLEAKYVDEDAGVEVALAIEDPFSNARTLRASGSMNLAEGLRGTIGVRNIPIPGVDADPIQLEGKLNLRINSSSTLQTSVNVPLDGSSPTFGVEYRIEF